MRTRDGREGWFSLRAADWTITVGALAIASTASARSYEDAWTYGFSDDRGAAQTLTASPNGRDTLALFWATWCASCKEELHLVEASKARLASFETVAISVDEGPEQAKATDILRGLGWTSRSLFDSSGALFYEIQPSGQLPLALVFSPDGRLKKRLDRIDSAAIEALLGGSEGANQRWSLTEDLFLRDSRHLGSTFRDQAIASALNVRYSGESWNVEATHLALRQKRFPLANWLDWEIELGRSSLEWKGNERWRVKLGDESVHWIDGQLFSTRVFPKTDENASVLGAHLQWRGERATISLLAGRPRDQLFGFQLDPAQDLSKTLPAERVAGTLAQQSIGERWSIEGGLVRYVRTSDVALGYPQELGDTRASGAIRYRGGRGGLRLSGAKYFEAPGDPYASQVDGDYEWSRGWVTTVSWTEFRDLPPRSFIPTLVEAVSTPLNALEKRSFRVLPRIQVFASDTLEPGWIHERTLDGQDRQNLFTLAYQRPQDNFKAIGYFQRQWGDEIFAETGAQILVPLGGIVSAQLEARSHRERPLSDGEMIKVVLAADIGSRLGWLATSQLVLSLGQTYQNGFWERTSGISGASLTSGRIDWKNRIFRLGASFGKEPGGVVCSGGICAQRAPLNGVRVDFGTQLAI